MHRLVNVQRSPSLAALLAVSALLLACETGAWADEAVDAGECSLWGADKVQEWVLRCMDHGLYQPVFS